MIGIAIVFILSGREPGWQPFAVSGLLALSFLITAFLFPDDSQWVGFLAMAVLLMTMFWQRDNPLAALIGVVLTILNALSARRNDAAVGSVEAKPSGEPSEPAMPAEPS
jgi:hypothetical protein